MNNPNERVNVQNPYQYSNRNTEEKTRGTEILYFRPNFALMAKSSEFFA
ncbi:hypothetical protein HMPREF9554_02395 [Treponema phagedenis F0421]|nr:hypothetical protein HMPREF9554_02395 [Treponema phagedenis F0421]